MRIRIAGALIVALTTALTLADDPQLASEAVLPQGTLREFPLSTVPITNSITKSEAVLTIDNGPSATSRRRFYLLFGGHAEDLTATATGKVGDDFDQDVNNGIAQPVWIMETSNTPAAAQAHAVARGWYPIIRTNIVRAVSPSTTFLVQVSPETGTTRETHRVLLIEGSLVNVYDNPTTSTGALRGALTVPGHYIEAVRNADGTISWSAVLTLSSSTTGDAAQFRKFVNTLMRRPAALELMKIPD